LQKKMLINPILIIRLRTCLLFFKKLIY